MRQCAPSCAIFTRPGPTAEVSFHSITFGEREKRQRVREAESRSLEVLTGSSGLVYRFQRFTKDVFRPVGWSNLEILAVWSTRFDRRRMANIA